MSDFNKYSPIAPKVSPALKELAPLADTPLYAAARRQVLNEYAQAGASAALRKARTIREAYEDMALMKAVA